MSKLIIGGLGGIGTQLLLPLLQYINYDKKDSFDSVFLIDGDKYEEKNLNRQDVKSMENKALSQFQYYKDMFENINFQFIDKYISENNISVIVDEGDVVLLCVDNNKTRLLFENYIKGDIENLTIISGGNKEFDGNVNIIHKIDSELMTPLMTEIHPEVGDGKDKNPAEMSCEELAASGTPQISIVNATIADLMRRTLFAMLNGSIDYYEIFVDCLSGKARHVKIGLGKEEVINGIKFQRKKMITLKSLYTQYDEGLATGSYSSGIDYSSQHPESFLGGYTTTVDNTPLPTTTLAEVSVISTPPRNESIMLTEERLREAVRLVENNESDEDIEDI